MIALAAFISLAIPCQVVCGRPLKLFELATGAHLTVAGEIVQVGDKTFDLAIRRTLLGGPEEGTLRVQRPSWGLEGRWTEYAEGQRVLLFLRRLAGGRVGLCSVAAEYPLVGEAAVVQLIRIHGFPPGRYAVAGGTAEGTLVPVENLAAALGDLPRAFEWTLDNGGWVKVIGFRSQEAALRMRAASAIGLHLYDEVVSSDQWKAAAPAVTFPLHAERLEGVAGRTCSYVGDVDGNGVTDLATGSRIHLMGESVEIARTVELEARAGSRYGMEVAPLGDLDGNGVPDIAAIKSDLVGDMEVSREVCVILLDGTGRTLRSVEVLRQEVVRGFLGMTHGLASTLAALGDLDGDGRPELAIGRGSHSVLIVSLDAEGMVRWTRSIPEREEGFAFSPIGSCFGSALAGLGDVDGDGVPDLALGDPGDADGGSGRGAVWIVGLVADGTPRWVQKISDLEGGFEGLIRDQERLGESLASPGDVDGDGVPDLVACGQSGIWVLFLNPDGTVKRHTCAAVGREQDAGVWLASLSASCEPHPTLEPGSVRLAVGSLFRGEDGEFNDALWLLRLCSDGTVDSQ